MQFAQLPEQQSSPRGRWYLKLREKTRCPAAKSAEPIVSPSYARTGSPANVKTPIRASGRSARPGAGRQAHQSPTSSVSEDLVRARVALGQEPDLAAEAVVPPLALDAGDVAAEVEVVGQLARASGVGFGRDVTSPA